MANNIITVIGYNDFKTLTGTFGAPTYSCYACGFGGSPTIVKVTYAFFTDMIVNITMNVAVNEADFILDFSSAVKLENMLAFA